MVKLKLSLNFEHSTTIYAKNGKAYTLRPGTNILNLEYNDYISLAEALSITPVENKNTTKSKDALVNETTEQVNDHKDEVVNDDHKDEVVNETTEQVNETTEQVNETTEQVNDHKDEVVNETTEQVNDDHKDEVVNETTEKPDYSTWSYTKLKNEYKAITGNSCKLKKDEVIEFLQGM